MKTETDKRVRALVASRAAESSTLDYKATPYDSTEGGRKEFAKDISGFANRDGGLLILGIKEKAGFPENIIGVDTNALDSVILWMESVARSAISPHIANITFTPVDLEGKTVVAVEIPRGIDGPYEVSSAGSRFFVRDERSVRPMSREELRFSIRQQADLFERIDQFVEDSWKRLCSGSPSNSLTPQQGGSLLITTPIFPDTLSFKFDVATAHNQFPHFTAFNDEETSSAKGNLDGLIYRYRGTGDETIFQGHTIIHRAGAIEMADGYVFNMTPQRQALPGTHAMSCLLRAIERSVDTSSQLTGAQRFVLHFRVRTEAGTGIAFYKDPFGRYGKVDRSELMFDSLTLELEDDWKKTLPFRARPLLDQLWQAFGYLNCGYFQGEEYRPPR